MEVSLQIIKEGTVLAETILECGKKLGVKKCRVEGGTGPEEMGSSEGLQTRRHAGLRDSSAVEEVPQL